MKIPQGFPKENETHVCWLRNSLDSLNHASRNWYHNLKKFLLSINFRQSKANRFLFLPDQDQDRSYTTILIYVDDVIIVGNNFDHVHRTQKQLGKAFSYYGELKYVLGIEVEKNKDCLVLT